MDIPCCHDRRVALSRKFLRSSVFSVALTSTALAQVTIGAVTHAGIRAIHQPNPLVVASAVTNGASFTANLSPGSIATIFGTGLATSTAQAESVPLPATLGGAIVTVNGIRAPLFYSSRLQINFQIPYETLIGPASVVVTVAGDSSAPLSVPVQAASPGIFMFGSNRAVAQNPGYSINDANNPVAGGSYIVVYLTGMGPMDNPVADGASAPLSPLSGATSQFSATIGGENANVFFLGLTPGAVGLAQANITVPDLPAGTYPLVITIDGVPSNAPLVTVSLVLCI